MKAHVEILSGIVRAGFETDAYGRPFEFMVAFSCVDGKHAVIKGLTTSIRQPSVAKAAFKALRALGLEPIWARRRNGKVQKRRAPPGRKPRRK